MVALTTIPLGKLKICENWKNAQPSTLLQMRVRNDMTVVGLRSHKDAGHGRSALYFLVLEGANRGTLLEDDMMRQHALDVSALLEISVSELSPTPFVQHVHGDLLGLVCEHGVGSGHFCVQARSIGGIQRVCLVD